MVKRRFLIILLCLLFLAGVAGPAAAAQSPSPVVHAIMFWMEGCGHCDWVKKNTLPPLSAQYGDQWRLELIELRSAADFDRLFALGRSLGFPPEAIGVPFLLIGDDVLIGAQQIPAELPGMIEKYLSAGGVGWPSYPALESLLPDEIALPRSPGAVVQTILFSTPDCHDCQLITAQALVPLREQYGDALQVQSVNIVTLEDVNYLYQIAAEFDVSQEQAALPMLIIGERVLIGEQIPAALPGLVEQHLSDGGVNAPVLPARPDVAPEPATDPAAPDERVDGFALAIAILVGMAVALLYTALRLLGARRGWLLATHPDWLQKAIPILAFAGLAVAAYLAYVETQAVAAVCGPVGDCNAVQSSEYAYLFGIPIGVLGVIGYVAILAAWGWSHWHGDPRAPLALLGMTAVGVLFSIYLTYLEPFVIGAVCAWCLTSAVIMALLLMASVDPAARQLAPARARRRRGYR